MKEYVTITTVVEADEAEYVMSTLSKLAGVQFAAQEQGVTSGAFALGAEPAGWDA